MLAILNQAFLGLKNKVEPFAEPKRPGLLGRLTLFGGPKPFSKQKIKHVLALSNDSMDRCTYKDNVLNFPDLLVVLSAIRAGAETSRKEALKYGFPDPGLKLQSLVFDQENVLQSFTLDAESPSRDFFRLLGLIGRSEMHCNLLDQVEELTLLDRRLSEEDCEDLCCFITKSTTLTSVTISGYNSQTAHSMTLDCSLGELICEDLCLEMMGTCVLGAFLPKCGSLTLLDMSHNHVGGHTDEPGVHQLAAALRVNTTITDLDISFNDFDDECGLVVADAIKENTTLRKLRISGDIQKTMASKGGVLYVTNEGSKEVAVDDTMTSADFSGLQMESCSAVILAAFIPRCTELTTVNILNNRLCKEGATIFIKMFKRNDNLTSICGVQEGQTALDLSGKGLDSADAMLVAAEMKGNEELAALDISKNRLTQRNLRIASNEHIQDSTHHNKLSEGGGLIKRDLSGVTLLSSILGEANDALESITFSGDDEECEPIHMHTNMVDADISHAVLQTTGAMFLTAFLPKCARFHRLTFSGDETFSQPVSMFTNMLDADFGSKDLRSTGALIIATVLPRCEHLVSLDLSNNDLGCDSNYDADMTGLVALFAAIKNNTSLTTLDISSNALATWSNQRETIDYKGVDALASALKKNKCLTDVNLSNNGLCTYGSVEGIVSLLAALEANT